MPLPLTRLVSELHRLAESPALDADLLERFARRRDEAAFGTLVERHGPMVLRLCRRVLGDVHAAEDAFQATFLVLARKAGSLGRPAALAPWLYAVAQRVALKARLAGLRRPTVQAFVVEPPDPAPDPLTALTARDLLLAMEEELARLPATYRMAVVTCCLEGRSRDEAAALLGCTTGALRGWLERGRARLHLRLARRGLTLGAAFAAAEIAQSSVGATAIAAAVKGAVVSSTASAAATQLATEVLGGAVLGRLPLTLLLTVGLGIGAIWLAQAEVQPVDPPASVGVAVNEKVGGGEKGDALVAGELYNDPLPEGALVRLGTTRFRVGSNVNAMALAPDGNTAVAVDYAETQFWDVATGKATRRIDRKQGGGGRVVAYSPDSRLVASVQDTGGLYLWDATTGKQLVEQGLRMNFTMSLAFSPDSKLLAAGGGQATYGSLEKTKSNSIISVWRWDGASLKPLWEAKPDHAAPSLGPRSHHICSLAFSPDGKHLATGGGNNNIIRIWDAAEGKEIRQFNASGTRVGALAFAPIATALASGSDDGVLTLWDLASGTKQWETKLPGEVRTLAFAPDGKTLVAGGGPEYGWSPGKDNNAILVMLDAGTGKDARPIGIARDSVASVAFSKDGKVLAAGLGGTLRFWHGTTGKERSISEGHENWISAVAVAEDGRVAVTAGGDGLLILWNLATGNEKRRLKGHQGEVRAVVFVPGGKLLASASTDQTVRLWDLTTGQETRLLRASPAGLLYSLAISPDGKLLAAGDYHDGSVYVWDLATGHLLRKLSIEEQLGRKLSIEEQLGHGVLCVAFSPDGRTLAAGETVLNARLGNVKGGQEVKGLIFLWDALNGKKLREFPGHAQAVSSLAFSADGTVLASTGWSDKTIDFWDVASGKKLFDLPCGLRDGVITFSPDGKTLACGRLPAEGICLWEMTSKKLRRKFSNSSAYVQSLAFSPDGKNLVSGCMDTTGLVWDVTGLRIGAKASSALSTDRLAVHWKALANPDPAEADRAIWSLSAHPKQAVPFIAERLRELPLPNTGVIHKLVADLDSDVFEGRQTAQQHLETLGKRAEPALRTALANRPSLEFRRRIESVLEKREAPIAAPEVLQVLRGIEVLEHTGTPEAREVLNRFAKRTADDYFKQESNAAVQRLTRRISRQ